MKSWERCYVEFLVRIAEFLGELLEGYGIYLYLRSKSYE